VDSESDEPSAESERDEEIAEMKRKLDALTRENIWESNYKQLTLPCLHISRRVGAFQRSVCGLETRLSEENLCD
jgi:hypothetical protein